MCFHPIIAMVLPKVAFAISISNLWKENRSILLEGNFKKSENGKKHGGKCEEA
jgi:hypothetical protein